MLLSAAGTDASELFNALHQPHALKNVEQHLVGTLEQGDDGSLSDNGEGPPLPDGWANIGLTTMAAPEDPRPASATNAVAAGTAAASGAAVTAKGEPEMWMPCRRGEGRGVSD